LETPYLLSSSGKAMSFECNHWQIL
jgi:hypothetical protein